MPSIIGGSLFTAWDVASQGGGIAMGSIPRRLATYVGAIYVYNLLQCPMEAMQGRPSAWHNILSGGFLGFLGVSRGVLGVPFVDPTFFYRYPQISPPLAGFAVYGAMGGLLATLGGKPF